MGTLGVSGVVAGSAHRNARPKVKVKPEPSLRLPSSETWSTYEPA